MRKRPLCIAALIWAVILWLLGKAGIPVLGYDPPDLPIDAFMKRAGLCTIPSKCRSFLCAGS